MKKIFLIASLVVGAAISALAQEGYPPAHFGSGTPDSIVRITMVLPGYDHPRTITVAVTDGWAKMEGDIVLGRIEDLQNPEVDDRGIVVESPSRRWPDAIIPYSIADGFTQDYLNLLMEAIDYINGSTHVFLVPSTGQSDCIRFKPSDECSSFVGQSGGTQSVKLMDPFDPANAPTGCWFKQIVHEVGHAVGLFHEQSREDRDNYVTIIWGNIPNDLEYNFEKENSDGMDIGPYDFASVMHYAPNEFGINGAITIVANGGQPFGFASEYSPGDREAINYLYPNNSCPINLNLSVKIRQVARPLFFESDDFLTSSAIISDGNSVTYDAGTLVRLIPGFRVDANAGSVFLAVSEGCGGIHHMEEPAGSDALIAENGQHGGSEPSMPLASSTAETSLYLDINPNPLSDKTAFRYFLQEPQYVSLVIHNMIGERVAVLVGGEQQEAGEYNYELTPKRWPAGVYFVTLRQGDRATTKRMVLTLP